MANTKNDFPSDMDDIEMIDITYEDGTSCSCEVIAHFDVEDISYAALLPEGDEDSDILVYRYSETEMTWNSARSQMRMNSTRLPMSSTRYSTILNSIRKTESDLMKQY